ncbi:unnamed protein product [Discula destructiva]
MFKLAFYAACCIVTVATPSLAQTLRICSDSTAANYAKDNAYGLQGWGYYIHNYLDIPVDNRARNGRSTRSFIADGFWDELLSATKAGDSVVVEMGHNDALDPTKSVRGTLRGIGGDSLTVNGTKVYTFGAYLRRMIADVQARDAVPIISGMVNRNTWSKGVLQADWPFADWAKQVAEAEGVAYVDHTAYSVALFGAMGEAKADKYFPNDHTHTNPAGADLNAKSFVQAVKCGKVGPLVEHLNANAKAVSEPSCR